jgi:hypothetical protein
MQLEAGRGEGKGIRAYGGNDVWADASGDAADRAEGLGVEVFGDKAWNGRDAAKRSWGEGGRLGKPLSGSEALDQARTGPVEDGGMGTGVGFTERVVSTL